MDKSSDGFVRADQIDLKSLDEQLERHLNRAWTMEKNKKKAQDDFYVNTTTITTTTTAVTTITNNNSMSATTVNASRRRHDWEIDPSKLIIKGVIARGTFGTVHRGAYDGQDVAG